MRITFSDPGGWRAAGLVGAWAVPLAGLAALAWYRPGWAIYVFAVLTAVALLGLKRTAAAGVLLLVAGIVPVAVSSLGSLLGFASLSVVSSAPVIAGILYLVSARIAGRQAPPAQTDTGPAERPKAA